MNTRVHSHPCDHGTVYVFISIVLRFTVHVQMIGKTRVSILLDTHAPKIIIITHTHTHAHTQRNVNAQPSKYSIINKVVIYYT